MRPSSGSLIAKRPVFCFALLNVSALIMSLVMYNSGTPARATLIVLLVTLATVNTLLIVMRKMVVTNPSATAEPTTSVAMPSRKRGWLFLVLGLYMFCSALYQILYPHLPSDKPLGLIILVCSPSFLWMAWREFRKAPHPRRSSTYVHASTNFISPPNPCTCNASVRSTPCTPANPCYRLIANPTELKGQPIMLSDKQLAANRANAEKSTGPRTVEGKNRSRLNALRHNLTGQVTTLTDPDRLAAPTRPSLTTSSKTSHLKELSNSNSPPASSLTPGGSIAHRRSKTTSTPSATIQAQTPTSQTTPRLKTPCAPPRPS